MRHVREVERRHTWDNFSRLLPELAELHQEEGPPKEANLPLFLATETALGKKESAQIIR